MLDAHQLIPLAFFAVPVAIVWIKKHYQAIERGALSLDGQSMADVVGKLKKRLKAVEADRDDLRARVENLESIACDATPSLPPKSIRGGLAQTSRDIAGL